MSRTRLPVWFYLAAASFGIYAALMVYSVVYPPAPVGVSFDYSQGERRIRDLVRASPAQRAGLQPRDHVVSIDGWPVDSPTASVSRMLTTKVDVPVVWVVERSGGDRPLPRRRVAIEVGSHGRELSSDVTPLLLLAVEMSSIVLGFFVVARRPRDGQALLGGAMLAGIGATPLAAPRGFIAVWLQLPAPIGALIWLPLLTGLFFPLLFFLFCATFPRRFVSRGVLAAVTASWLTVGIAILAYVVPLYVAPSARPLVPNTLLAGLSVLDVLSVPGGAALLAFAVRRVTDVNERRRIHILLAGLAAGAVVVTDAVIVLIAQAFAPLNPLLVPLDWVRPVVPFGLFLVPASFAYAILRHRLFDVPVIIRQGLQYAAARGVLLSAVPIVAAALVVDLLRHGNEPLIAILSSRGWMYAAIIGVAAVAHLQRGRWLASLDRRFFRERYEAERLLREIADDVRQAASFEAAVRDVAGRIERALHPAFVALAVRAKDAAAFSTLVSLPSGHEVALDRDAKVVGLVRVLAAPLDLSTTGWIADQVRAGDVEALQREGVDLLVPITTGLDRREAILVLGRKRSEEPYSRQDRELLGAVASSLAVLLERPAPAAVAGALRECPTCGRCYDEPASRCEHDGAMLFAGTMARALTPRYVLARRLGSGGMGTVYEARDVDLQRIVAVKVIKEDAAADPAFAQRFRQEALAAAAFAHPNVVTIYDFGVSADGRTFIVMERLQGRTLRDEMRAHGPLSPAQAAGVLTALCAAADAAHRRQIVHRDLKPENVFLVRDGAVETIKVVDFGIARSLAPAAASAVTGTGQIVGTLQYMAPEQVGGAKATAAADLWALSVMAYEMVTGANPFAGEAGYEWQRAALGRFPRLEASGMDALNAFFARAFASHPDARYPDAPELAAAFESAAAQSTNP